MEANQLGEPIFCLRVINGARLLVLKPAVCMHNKDTRTNRSILLVLVLVLVLGEMKIICTILEFAYVILIVFALTVNKIGRWCAIFILSHVI